MVKKEYWTMSDEEKETMLAEGIREEIAKHHAAGRATIHGNDKEVFLIHPDGRREYIILYGEPYLGAEFLLLKLSLLHNFCALIAVRTLPWKDQIENGQGTERESLQHRRGCMSEDGSVWSDARMAVTTVWMALLR